VWNLFAFSEQIMRAADCKPFAQKSFALLGKNSQPPAESAGGWAERQKILPLCLRFFRASEALKNL